MSKNRSHETGVI